MPGLNSAMNPDVVRTALDDVFYQGFNGDTHPGYATASNAMCLKQDTADSSAVIWDLFKGSGEWKARDEQADVNQSTPRVDDQKVFNVVNFANSIDISKNFFDDNKHSVYERSVEQFGRRAGTTQNKNAFAPYRNGFTTELTADGASLFSASHTNINGDTVDNLISGALTEASLNTGIVRLMEMVSQDGEIDGFMPSFLLVPPALFKLASEITKSELRSGTSDNDANIYSTQYNIQVLTSNHLGAAAGGSDTAWFLGSNEHSVTRFVRQGVQTSLINWDLQRNNDYIYKGEYREIAGAMTYEGIVGALGT